ncbi:helix-turn-helix domain-containing protein [Actinoplanes sp. NPDC051411]|uniref:helix-turn-helix domain-containing protein n=1 Tax=Actinoplanes sp. NPDC051411 TaxID=3155522 RepID=UPI003424973D
MPNPIDPKSPTRAQRFRDAVWESGPDDLSPTEALVLLAYADHARGGDSAWVAQSRLMQRCKIRSSSTPSRIVAGLVEKGWLELLARAQWRNRQSPTYRLVIPKTTSLIEVVGADQPPRSVSKPPRSRVEPPRSAAESSSMSEANHLDDRTPLSSERPSGLSGGEAPRPAPPRAALPGEDDPPAPAGPPGAARAAAFAAALNAKRRDVRISHWREPPPADPNPQYDPGKAAKAAAELPVFEFVAPTREEGAE